MFFPVNVGAFAGFEPDPFTILLLHGNGTDGSSTIIDETGKTVTVAGDAQIDTAQSVFGGSSILFDGTGDRLTIPGTNFGLDGDFVLEARIRFPSWTTWAGIISFEESSGNAGIFWGLDQTSSRLVYWQGGSNRITSSDLSVDTWYHVAAIRSGGVVRMFVDGVQAGADYSDGNSYTDPGTLYIGCDRTGASQWIGWLDEVRISKGTDRGWFSGFSVPGSPY